MSTEIAHLNGNGHAVPAYNPYSAHRSESTASIAKALAAVQGELEHPRKGTENPFFKSQYADLATIVDVAKPLLAKQGLSVTQIPTMDDQGNLVLITEVLHISGEWLRSRYPIRPSKNDPQGVGSAITYARRYAYQAMLGITPIGEDDDGNAASAPAPAPRPRPQQRQAAPKQASKLPGNPWAHIVEGDCQFTGTPLCMIDDEDWFAIAMHERELLLRKGRLTAADATAIENALKDQAGRYAAREAYE